MEEFMKNIKRNLLFITALIAGNSTFCMEKPDSNKVKEVEAKWAAWDETEQEKLTRETKSKSSTQEIAKQRTPSLASAEEQKSALILTNDLIKTYKTIAIIVKEIDRKQKRSLKRLRACHKRIEKLEKEIPAAEPDSLIKAQLNLHLAHAENIETNYKLMLINSILEKVFQQKEKIIKQIELLEPNKEVKLIMEYLKQDITNRDICKNIRKIPLKNNSDFKKEESLESCINNIAKKLEFTLSEDEMLLLDDAKINPDSFAKYLASNGEKSIETFAPIMDEKNNQVIYLHKHNIENKALNKVWFRSIKYNVTLWFKNPNAALELGGYNNPEHTNYQKKENAVSFHTFHNSVDPIAEQHSILTKQTDKLDYSILALMPGHIIQNGQATYGNFEFAFHDGKKCFHRFFKPLIAFKKKKDKSKKTVKNVEKETEKISDFGEAIIQPAMAVNNTTDTNPVNLVFNNEYYCADIDESESDDLYFPDEEYLDLEDKLVKKGKKEQELLNKQKTLRINVLRYPEIRGTTKAKYRSIERDNARRESCDQKMKINLK